MRTANTFPYMVLHRLSHSEPLQVVCGLVACTVPGVEHVCQSSNQIWRLVCIRLAVGGGRGGRTRLNFTN